MSENTNNTAGFDTADLEAAWADEDGGADGAQAALENQQGGAQQPENQPAAPEDRTDPEGRTEGQNQPGQQPENQPELFTIQYNGKSEQMTREQLLTLAQKGRNYDHVQQELEQLRQFRDEANPALELVKGYAQRNNMAVGDYLDWCRKQELMRTGMDEQAAGQKVQMEKERAELDAKQAQIQAEEQRRSSAQRQAQEAVQARQRDIAQFCRTYPGVDPKAIPQEVWEAVKSGDTLTNAYTMHENKRLAAELAAERQNKANKANTPGSLGGNSAAEMDEIDRLWGEDD